MSVVCIDTQILSWAILGQTSAIDDRLILRANHLLKKLDENKHRIIVASITVGELLTAIPDEEHADILGKFRQEWRIVDFNLRAAATFARMRRDWRTKQRIRDIRDYDHSATKTELVADVMIIATAMAHGASLIYSHNVNFRNMATGFIPVEDLPDDWMQLELIKDGYDE